VAVALSSGHLLVLNTETLVVLADVAAHDGAIYGLAWSPDGRAIATASGDELIRTWNAHDLSAIDTLVGHTGIVWSVVWPRDRRLISTGQAGSVRSWDRDAVMSGGVWGSDAIGAFAGGDGAIGIVTVGGVYLVDPETSQVLGAPAVAPGRLSRCTANTDAGLLAVVDEDGRIEVRELGDLSLRGTFDAVPGVRNLAISGDGRRLAILEPSNVRVIDIASGDVVAALNCVAGWGGEVVLDATGNSVWGPFEIGQICQRDVATGRVGAAQGVQLSRHKYRPGRMSLLEFSPDEKVVVVGGQWREICMYDASTLDELWWTDGHRGVVRSAVFVDGGQTLLTGGEDGTVRGWDVHAGDPLFREQISAAAIVGLVPAAGGAVVAVDAGGRMHTLRGS
jgi:WD40 repeat protein